MTHDLYDEVSIWLIWMPLALIAGAVLVAAIALMSPVLLPLYLWDRWMRRRDGLRGLTAPSTLKSGPRHLRVRRVQHHPHP
jgi:hypothetical protein